MKRLSLRGLGRDLRAFLSEQSGAVAALTTALLPVLIGLSAMGVDGAYWTMRHRAAQSAADAAAFSAAISASTGLGSPTTEAQAIAAKASFVNGQSGITVTVGHPTQGAYTGVQTAWEVTIQQPSPSFFARTLKIGSPNLVARAVANKPTSSACIVGLNPSAASTVFFAVGAGVTDPDCGIYSRSTAGAGFFTGSITCILCISRGQTWAAGYILDIGLVDQTHPNVAQSLINDPYAGVSDDPTTQGFPSTCVNGSAYGTKQVGGAANSAQLLPGHYCKGFDIGSGKTLNLSPGYYFVDTIFNLADFATINGTGVTIILKQGVCVGTGNCTGQFLGFSNGNGNHLISVNLTAPTTGPYAGIALMSLGASGTQTFSYFVNLDVVGAIYFPHQVLSLTAGVVIGDSDDNYCSQLIADTVQMAFFAYMISNCPNTGLKGVASGNVVLVE